MTQDHSVQDRRLTSLTMLIADRLGQIGEEGVAAVDVFFRTLLARVS